MYSVLEELFYGNIPGDKYFEKNSEYGQAMNTLASKEDELLAILSEKEKEVFSRFTNAQGEIINLTAKNKFIYGFKLGVQIALEALRDDLTD